MAESKLWTEAEKELVFKNHDSLSCEEMAAVLGRTRLSVYKFCKRSNLAVIRAGSKLWTEAEKELVFRNHDTLSCEEIAAVLGRTSMSVYKFCKRSNLAVIRKDEWTEAQKEFVKNNYPTMSHQEMADLIGRSEAAVRNFCYEHKYRRQEPPWSEEQLDILRQAYRDPLAPVNINSLVRLFGRPKSSISAKAKELGLSSRTRKRSEKACQERGELTRRYIKENGHPRGMLGKTHTPEVKAKLSERNKNLWADPNSAFNSDEYRQGLSDRSFELRRRELQQQSSNHNPYSRTKSGKRPDLGDKFFRSSWEANYARYLNWLVENDQIKKWEYEVDEFIFEEIKRGTRSYLPDFKITNLDDSVEYHEVKGWMDAKSQTKLNRMAKYYPSVKIVLIDKKAYVAIEKTAKSLVSNWE